MDELENYAFDLLLLEVELAIKHGSHNQATHGRKTGRRSAYASAYSAARGGGASVGEARAKAKQESRTFAQQEREQRLQQRTERLQTQAERARRAAGSGQMTESQARRALQRAENLEARARGEAVPNRRGAAKNPHDAEVAGLQKRVKDIDDRMARLTEESAQDRIQSQNLFNEGWIYRMRHQTNSKEYKESLRRLEEVRARLAPVRDELEQLRVERDRIQTQDIPAAVTRQRRFNQENSGAKPKPEDLVNRLRSSDPEFYREQARLARVQLQYNMDKDGKPLTEQGRRSLEQSMRNAEILSAARERSAQFRNINPDTLPAINARSERGGQVAEERRREALETVSRLREPIMQEVSFMDRLPPDRLESTLRRMDRVIEKMFQITDEKFWIDMNLGPYVREKMREEQD